MYTPNEQNLLLRNKSIIDNDETKLITESKSYKNDDSMKQI